MNLDAMSMSRFLFEMFVSLDCHSSVITINTINPSHMEVVGSFSSDCQGERVIVGSHYLLFPVKSFWIPKGRKDGELWAVKFLFHTRL